MHGLLAGKTPGMSNGASELVSDGHVAESFVVCACLASDGDGTYQQGAKKHAWEKGSERRCCAMLLIMVGMILVADERDRGYTKRHRGEAQARKAARRRVHLSERGHDLGLHGEHKEVKHGCCSFSCRHAFWEEACRRYTPWWD